MLLQRLNQRVTNLEHVFEKADDGSGSLNPSELKELISSYVNELDEPDEDDAMELINFIDRNGDQTSSVKSLSHSSSPRFTIWRRRTNLESHAERRARDMIQAFSRYCSPTSVGRLIATRRWTFFQILRKRRSRRLSVQTMMVVFQVKEDADRGAEVVLHLRG